MIYKMSRDLDKRNGFIEVATVRKGHWKTQIIKGRNRKGWVCISLHFYPFPFWIFFIVNKSSISTVLLCVVYIFKINLINLINSGPAELFVCGLTDSGVCPPWPGQNSL